MFNCELLWRRKGYVFYLDEGESVRHDQRVRDVQPHSISVFARALRRRSTSTLPTVCCHVGAVVRTRGYIN
ncbi:hypothetical protein QQF64_016015 [Cirrhinus molitorella]|uniref:MHC class I antigen n=1 Tax=Cirrhinus molitorella TaxID=172907 RepID=A0ABR3LNZ8_9TELE